MKINQIILIFIIFLFNTICFADSIKIDTKFFVDKEHSYAVENIYENKNIFKEDLKKNANFGLTKDTIWIYINIKNLSNQSINNVITLPYSLLDFVHVLEYENTKLQDSYLTGDLTKFDTRKIQSNDFKIPYTLKSQQTKEFILKIDSQGALNINLNFDSQENQHIKDINRILIMGIYFGAIIIMLLYNFFLYFAIKDKVYLDYVIFHFSYLLLQLGLNGLAFQYIWPNSPDINFYFVPLMLTLANFFSIKFSLSFLDMNNISSKLNKYFKNLMYLHSIIIVLIFTTEYSTAVKIFAFFSIITVSSLFISGIYILIKYKTISSKFYVTAWSFLLVGVLSTEFQNIGLLPTNFFTFYGTQIGAFCELTLLSFALAHKYNSLFFQLKKTEDNLNTVNQNLENTVFKRTQDLNEELNNKNVLLRELHHRVKNNLQIISSLISLQTTRISDENSKKVLMDTNFRILSISLIHEKLFMSKKLEQIPMLDYIHTLTDELRRSFSESSDILFEIKCEDIDVDLEQSVPIGLIINELITNSIKYAFKGIEKKDKKISIIVEKKEDSKLYFAIFDNGKGVDLDSIKQGFGFKLLKTLTSYQLKADVKYYNQDGFHYEIIF